MAFLDCVIRRACVNMSLIVNHKTIPTRAMNSLNSNCNIFEDQIVLYDTGTLEKNLTKEEVVKVRAGCNL